MVKINCALSETCPLVCGLIHSQSEFLDHFEFSLVRQIYRLFLHKEISPLLPHLPISMPLSRAISKNNPWRLLYICCPFLSLEVVLLCLSPIFRIYPWF